MASIESQRFYCKVGAAVGDIGEIKYGFVAPEEAYTGIADELGVIVISNNDSARGVAFGINYPKPPRVTLNAVSSEEGVRKVRRSVKRFCDTDKLGRVLNGSLNDAQVLINGTQYQIRSASISG
ncbi:MAG: hypothetical protein AAF827_03875 [Cyanobacteria bacterium P01_D01_bin.6]